MLGYTGFGGEIGEIRGNSGGMKPVKASKGQ